MPTLGRTSGRLLRTVNGKPHATQDDHVDALPTPPPSNTTLGSFTTSKAAGDDDEDISGSPKSSSDEAPRHRSPESASGSGFKASRQLDGTNDSPSVGAFRRPVEFKPHSRSPKRDAEVLTDEDTPIFSSQGSFAKKHKSSKAGVANIHAPTSSARSQTTYGKAATRPQQKRDGAGFKKPAKIDLKAVKVEEKTPAFRKAQGGDMFAFGSSPMQFKPAKGAAESVNSDSVGSLDLSELSEPDSDIEELDAKTLGLPDPEPYAPFTICKICHVQVPLLIQQEFEDRYMEGEGMTYKVQQWFCKYHRKAKARETWEVRGYPEIQWRRLDARLKKHHKHLTAVLNGRMHSIYRDRLQQQVDAGTSKTVLSLINADSDGEAPFTPGYYGPRGEKLCMEHVSSHFGDALRTLKDPLVAASGVKGGVSGFVQGVLVPELIVQLVIEDLNVSPERARAVLAESVELGELLSGEVQEDGEDMEMEV
ncbi:hypothetical protein B0A48_18087 [Cryoendolithus antarcticus]|uniref:Restriction of telomere capping protein 4 n=1 Tax=Cryoendolithus antarcticus TaxID=1507870 RepID=A0A1V8S9J8_9PEZI|nr:hypothetical protein B0A48_18087 [Cryoendolithus antarcticus]